MFSVYWICIEFELWIFCTIVWHLATDFACKNCADSGKGFFLCKALHIYALILVFIAWILGPSSLCILAVLLCMQRKYCTASMLGFLLFFFAYRAVSFVVELHCYARILALFLCMQRKNCTAMLGFLFYFKMLTKPCHSLERKHCHSLHIWQVQFWEQGSKLSHMLFLWFLSIASSSAWSAYKSQTVVWSPAVLKSLMWQSCEAKLKCKGSWFILWEMYPDFLSFSCLGTFQCNLSCRRTTKTNHCFSEIWIHQENGIKISTKKGNCQQRSTHAQ